MFNQTLYPAEFWIGYRYEVYRDDKSTRNVELRRKIRADFKALEAEGREIALKGCEYAAKEREEIRKNFRARESFDSERLDSVERLVLGGKTAREIALEIGIAHNTATRYRRELVRRGRLPKSVLNRGKQ